MALGPTSATSTVIHDLAPLEVGYALGGGLVVSVRGAFRFTRDIDTASRVGDDAKAS